MIKPPKEFFSRIEEIYKDKSEFVISWLKRREFTVFRINTLKSSTKEIEWFLKDNSIPFEKLDFSDLAYLIWKEHEYFLKWSDIFYSWKIYLQSYSSQLPAIFLDPNPWDIVLDATAAPWWKTTQIAAIMNNSWTIVACEKNQIRFDKLNYNCNLQWNNIVNCIKSDITSLKTKFPEMHFDKILVDAPCSAEWRIDLQDERTFWFWTEKNIQEKSKLQKNILETVIPLLKKWWELIYSTCTLAPEENELVVSEILDSWSYLELCPIISSIENSIPWISEYKDMIFVEWIGKTLRILPTSRQEWFYIAKIKRID